MSGWALVERRQRELWDQAITEARFRLARLEAGDAWAPPSVVRALRAFVAPEVRR